MKTLLEINSVLNYGSTGKIAEQIGELAEKEGFNVWYAHGARYKNQTKLKNIQVNSLLDAYIHAIYHCRLKGTNGLGSRKATERLVDLLESKVQPDIIHLHNIHNYYLNYEVLFRYLQKHDNIRVVWTLHDCWSFTGGCFYFDYIGCKKWQYKCCECTQKHRHSFLSSSESREFQFGFKQDLFTSLGDRLVLVPVSEWLGDFLKDSFFSHTKSEVIHNGIDISRFSPRKEKENQNVRSKYGCLGKKVVLGVAMPWGKRKGFDDFINLRGALPDDYAIVMVGLAKKQLASLPQGIIGVERTQSADELADIYSMADVFVNSTYQDNYPTVNLEAIACGTPVVTYRTGGSPESVTATTGRVVEKGNLNELAEAIRNVCLLGKSSFVEPCREYASRHFDNAKCFRKYIDLYNEILV